MIFSCKNAHASRTSFSSFSICAFSSSVWGTCPDMTSGLSAKSKPEMSMVSCASSGFFSATSLDSSSPSLAACLCPLAFILIISRILITDLALCGSLLLCLLLCSLFSWLFLGLLLDLFLGSSLNCGSLFLGLLSLLQLC
jgi:hypothetical protein